MSDPQSSYTPPDITDLRLLIDLFRQFLSNDADTPATNASGTRDSLAAVLKRRFGVTRYPTSASLASALSAIDAPQLVLDEQARVLYAVIFEQGANVTVEITSAAAIEAASISRVVALEQFVGANDGQGVLGERVVDLETLLGEFTGATLTQRLDGVRDLIEMQRQPRRPGDSPSAFTLAWQSGVESASQTPAPASGAETGTYGRHYRIDGQGQVSAREATGCGGPMRITCRVARLIDSSDPNNDTVRLGVLRLGAAKVLIDTLVIEDVTDLTVLDGLRTVTGTIPYVDGPDYVVPFVRVFGGDGATAVVELFAEPADVEASLREADGDAAADRTLIREEVEAADEKIREEVEAADQKIRDEFAAADEKIVERIPRAATELEILRGAVGDDLYVTASGAMTLRQSAVDEFEQVALFTLLGATYQYGEPGYYLSQYSIKGPHGPAQGLDTIEQRYLDIAFGTKAIILPRGASLSPKLSFAVDDGTVQEIRFVAGRVADVSDPLGDSLEYGIAWLNGNEGDSGVNLTETVLHDFPAVAADGLIQRTAHIGPVDGAIEPPVGAVRWRPFIRNHGSGGKTAATLLRIRPAPGSGTGTGSVPSGLEDRISDIEARNVFIGRTDYTLDGMPAGTAFLGDPTGENAAGLLASKVLVLTLGVDDQTGAQLIGEVVGSDPRLLYRPRVSGMWGTPIVLASEGFVQTAVNDLAQSFANGAAGIGSGSDQVIDFDPVTGGSSLSFGRRDQDDETFVQFYTADQPTGYIGQVGSDNLLIGVDNKEGGTRPAIKVHAGTAAVEFEGENFVPWTPVLSASDTAPEAVHDQQYGRLERINDAVKASFSMEVSGLAGGAGAIRIDGIPWPSFSNIRYAGLVFIEPLDGGVLTLPTGTIGLVCYNVGGKLTPHILMQGQAGLLAVTPGDLSASCRIYGSFRFQAAPGDGYTR